MHKIYFFSADKPIPLKSRKSTKNLIQRIFFSESKMFRKVSFVFCSDEYLLKINTQYLKHNYYTDVITFTISLPGDAIESEIYISVDRIKENAKTYNVLYQNELLRVIIHGVLHLCGYNDQKPLSKQIMKKKEDLYLQLNINDA